MSQKKPYIVGVSGGSASGKTFLLTRLLERFDSTEITLISQDNYYRKIEEQEREANGEINFDHPKALELDRCAADVAKVAAGEVVTIKEYTFNNPNKVPRDIVFNPTPIVLVEGLFVFYHEKTCDQLDLRIFVDADEHIKLSRRIIRDAEERGYPLDEVLDMYQNFVMPMYRQYVEPFKWDCDLILHNNTHIDKAIQVLIDHFEAILRK